MRNIHSRFFIKNFLIFLIPLLIPLLILGVITTTATRDFVKAEITKNNLTLLGLTKNNLELIFDEMDSLYLNFSTNSEVFIKLKKILVNPKTTLSLEELYILKMVQNILDTRANAHSYINSIYVYVNNPNQKIITTTEGLTDLKTFSDTSWYDSYVKYGEKLPFWTEPRIIRRYSFERNPTCVVTIYRRLYTSGSPNAGVIVLNIQTKYIERLLDKLETIPQQGFIIVDANNRIIFRNRQAKLFQNRSLMQVVKNSRNNFVSRRSRGDYSVSYLLSPKYRWKYISIVPQQILYAIPLKLQKRTLFLLPLLFGLGLALTFWLTHNNYLRIQNIISIIDAAKADAALPILPARINDEYGFITYNLLTTFIEQNYLKLQLSERKYKLQVMELLALQSQINPHFLFNTLDAVKWQVIGLARKPNETSTMIEKLSDILKYSLQQPRQTVLLREEIQNTQNYIDILKILYRDKLDFIWDYDEKVLDLPVIRLLFQPLIENSIYHGVKGQEEQHCLKVKIQRQNAWLRIAIIDNGAGIPPEKLQQIREKINETTDGGGHIGLGNTKKRLELTFGEQTLLTINSKLNFGTVITIKIPIIQTDISENLIPNGSQEKEK